MAVLRQGYGRMALEFFSFNVNVFCPILNPLYLSESIGICRAECRAECRDVGHCFQTAMNPLLSLRCFIVLLQSRRAGTRSRTMALSLIRSTRYRHGGNPRGEP